MKQYIEIEHPGEMLEEDFLSPLGVRPGALARAIKVDRAAIKNILDGKRAISAEMAIRLSLFFGTRAFCILIESKCCSRFLYLPHFWCKKVLGFFAKCSSAEFWLNLQKDYDLRTAKAKKLAQFSN